MSEQKACPICQGEMDDTRHVGVECFYQVTEVVPTAEQETVFVEVDEGPAMWGITRRHGAGTRDKHRSVRTGEDSIRIETDQEPVPAIRLFEKTLYNVTCCKPCRADFLGMFAKWARGELRPRRPDDDDANIPVRVNGATMMMTRAEYDQFKANQ